MMKFSFRSLIAGMSLLLPLGALAKAPELVAVKVFPPDVNLSSKVDYQAVVVQAVYSDSTTRDVTAQTTMTLADKARCEQLVSPLRLSSVEAWLAEHWGLPAPGPGT